MSALQEELRAEPGVQTSWQHRGECRCVQVTDKAEMSDCLENVPSKDF